MTSRKRTASLFFTHIYIAWILSVQCFSQSISLKVSPQEGCKHGVLDSEHIIILRCIVYFGRNNIQDWSHAVVFNITKRSGENKSIVVDLNSVSERPNKNHSCSYVDKGTYYEVHCHVVARKDLSRASINAYIGHLEYGNIYSVIEKLPYVYDRNDIHMSVNGRNINSSSCWLDYSQMDQSITACCDNSPSPCTTEIRRNGVLLHAGAPCATSGARPAEGAQYQLSVFVCDEPTPVKSVICNTYTRSSTAGLRYTELTTILVLQLLLYSLLQ